MSTKEEILVEVKDVSKKFSRSIKRSMYYGLRDMMSAMLGSRSGRSTLRPEEFWAVRNVNFTLKRGECLGLIGRNGAGKSTLLKMLNGLIVPDEGSITMRGKVSALIELGAGFNPLLTGRENIYINGQLLGLSRKEIDERLESIIDFSEIREFIDSPVQNYSSGMRVRLGFAVAAQMQPDVLIIDEVLAVGDLGFVLKCYNAIDSLLKNTAVIFVSHSMPQVSRICSKIMLMEKGQSNYLGEDIAKGIDLYFSKFNENGKKADFERGGDAELVSLIIHPPATKEEGGVYKIQWLEDLSVTLNINVKTSFREAFVILSVFDKEGRPAGICQNPVPLSESNRSGSENGYNNYITHVIMPRINLSKGIYSLTVVVTEEFRQKPMLRVHTAANLQVSAKNANWHPIEFEGKWS